MTKKVLFVFIAALTLCLASFGQVQGGPLPLVITSPVTVYGPNPASNMGTNYRVTGYNVMTVTSFSPFHATVTFYKTLMGSYPLGLPITHQGALQVSVGNHSSNSSTNWQAPDIYINLTQSVTLDTGVDLCLSSTEGCEDNSVAYVYCSEAPEGVAIATFPFTLVKWEVAHTRVIATSAIASGSFVKNGITFYNYPVANWCIAALTPPDNDFTNSTVAWPGLAQGGYDTAAIGINILNMGWEFTNGAASALNGTIPQGSTQAQCTKS